MRVLFVNHAALIGGAETNLLNILRFAEKGGYEPVGLLLPFDGPLSSEACRLGVKVGRIRYYGFSWRNPSRYAQTMVQLVSWIQHTRPAVIHLNHQWLVSFIAQAGLVTRTPVVCHTRNYLNEQFVSTNRRWLNMIQAIVVESQAVKQSALDLGLPKERIHLVHNGIDYSRFQSTRLAERHEAVVEKKSGPVIGFSGRIVPEKGPEDLISAIPLVLSYAPSAQFCFLGSDQEGGAFVEHLKEKTMKLGVQHSVQFLGFRDNVEDLIRDFDVLVIPSRNSMPEGLPLTALEGLAAGCLVVATPNSGIPELIHEGKTGFLVASENIESLSHGIISALKLSTSAAQDMRCMSRTLVESQFGIDGQVAQLGEIYGKLAE